MRPSWQPGAIAMTLCHIRHRTAVDLQIETQVPSEVRRSLNNQAARREMTIRPKVTFSPLCNSSDANCADKTKSQTNVPREAMFWFHDTHSTCGVDFCQR